MPLLRATAILPEPLPGGSGGCARVRLPRSAQKPVPMIGLYQKWRIFINNAILDCICAKQTISLSDPSGLVVKVPGTALHQTLGELMWLVVSRADYCPVPDRLLM
jgi:hypothetical protein